MERLDLDSALPTARSKGEPLTDEQKWHQDAVNRVRRMKVPERYRESRFSQFDCDPRGGSYFKRTKEDERAHRRKALNVSMDWCNKHDWGSAKADRSWMLLIQGHVGTGKTTLGTAALNRLVYSSKTYPPHLGKAVPTFTTGQWLRSQQLWQWVLEAMRYDHDSPAVHKMRSCGVLMMEDLCLSGSDKQIEHVMEIMNHRYDRFKPTIVTTNWNREEFAEISEPFASRLFLDNSTIVTLLGEDRRK